MDHPMQSPTPHARCRCGAKTRQGGECASWAMPNGRCRMHGGLSLGGVASPTFKTGRWSKYIPGRMLERYQEAQADDALLELREDIALLDSRLADVLSRVDTGESGSLWRQARAAWEASQSADVASAVAAKLELEDLFTRGVADYAAWGEVQRLLQERRKVVESERKRQIELQQMITVERALLLVTAVVDSVRTHVNDPAVLGAISQDLLRLTAGAGRDVVDGHARRD